MYLKLKKAQNSDIQLFLGSLSLRVFCIHFKSNSEIKKLSQVTLQVQECPFRSTVDLSF